DLVEAACTRLLALVATTRGLAQPRADAAADAALGVLGAGSRLDAIEFHIRLSQRLLLEHFDQVTDLVDHAAHRGRVLQLAHAVELAQAQAAHGGAMRFLGADRALDQLHLERLLWRRHVDAPGFRRRVARRSGRAWKPPRPGSSHCAAR